MSDTLYTLYCRAFQSLLKIGNYFMGYRTPEYLEGPGKVRELGAFLQKKGINDVLVVTGSGMSGSTDTEKAEAFLRWMEETNRKMGLPDHFDMIHDEDVEQMIDWAMREANPLYPVPVIWDREQFRALIGSISAPLHN